MNKKIIMLPGQNSDVVAATYLYDNWTNINEVESFYMLFLNRRLKIIACECLCVGGEDTVSVSDNKPLSLAVKYGAEKVIFAHNHPSGSLSASDCDINFTQLYHFRLAAIGVNLLDHIILTPGGTEFLSFQAAGLMLPIVEQTKIKMGIMQDGTFENQLISLVKGGYKCLDKGTNPEYVYTKIETMLKKLYTKHFEDLKISRVF